MMDFKVGDKVTALIYNRNQKWMEGTVVGMTSEKEMKDGYRFGIHVEIEDGSIHWVSTRDCKKKGELYERRNAGKDSGHRTTGNGDPDRRNAVKVDFLGEKFWIEKDLLEVPGFGDNE